MSNELPDKVIRMDVVRVEQAKMKSCECFEPHYTIDTINRLVYCKDCGAIVDPFNALTYLAEHYDRIAKWTETILEQRRQIESYKPHLVVIKQLEEQCRANKYSMMPVCPHCKEPFELSDLRTWVNRAFHLKNR